MTPVRVPLPPMDSQVAPIVFRPSKASRDILARYGMGSKYDMNLAERWSRGLIGYVTTPGLMERNRVNLERAIQSYRDSVRVFWKKVPNNERVAMKTFLRWAFSVMAIAKYEMQLREIESVL